MLEGVITIEPQPTPRPRVKRMGGVYYPNSYLEYKNKLITLLLSAHQAFVFREELTGIHTVELTFFFAYPKATAKKNRIDGVPCYSKGDLDNLAKGVLDAMEQAGIIENDRKIAHLDLAKYWTIGESRIAYYLTDRLPEEHE